MFGTDKVTRLREYLKSEKEEALQEKLAVFKEMDSGSNDPSLKDKEAFLCGVGVGLLKAQGLINKVYGAE